MKTTSSLTRSSKRQSGAAVIEFAFVFPIMFMLMYGTIVYGYVFFLNQSLNYAVQQAAESAVAVDPTATNVVTVRNTRINTTINSVLSWMNATQRTQRLTVMIDQASATCPAPLVAGTVKVELVYALRNPSWLFPVINMGFGQIPPLPDNLNACATALIQSQT